VTTGAAPRAVPKSAIDREAISQTRHGLLGYATDEEVRSTPLAARVRR